MTGSDRKPDASPANGRLPWFRFYAAEYLLDGRIRSITLEQRAMFMELRAQAWYLGGYLPNDSDNLWRLAGARSRAAFEKHRAKVLFEFDLDSDRNVLVNRTLTEYWEEAVAQSKLLSMWGKKGAMTRWRDSSHGQAIATPMAEPYPSHSYSESELESEEESETENQVLLSKPCGLDATDAGDSSCEDAGEVELRNSLTSDSAPANVKKIVAGLRAEVFEYYLAKTGRNPKLYELTKLRRLRFDKICEKVLAKTVPPYSGDKAVEVFHHAIDRMCESDFHMGRDPKSSGHKYNEWDQHLFRNWEQFERWLNR